MNTCTYCPVVYGHQPIVHNGKPFCDKICRDAFLRETPKPTPAEKEEPFTTREMKLDLHFI